MSWRKCCQVLESPCSSSQPQKQPHSDPSGLRPLNSNSFLNWDEELAAAEQQGQITAHAVTDLGPDLHDQVKRWSQTHFHQSNRWAINMPRAPRILKKAVRPMGIVGIQGLVWQSVMEAVSGSMQENEKCVFIVSARTVYSIINHIHHHWLIRWDNSMYVLSVHCSSRVLAKARLLASVHSLHPSPFCAIWHRS